MSLQRVVFLFAVASSVFLASQLNAQAMSGPRTPACPPQVNPVRNKAIRVYITTQLTAPAPMGMIWSTTTRQVLIDRLNQAGREDGNRFTEVKNSEDSNIDLHVTADNASENTVYTLKMISWNSLQVEFSAASGDGSDPVKTLVEKIYEYFHLGYQAGPDVCRPWIK